MPRAAGVRLGRGRLLGWSLVLLPAVLVVYGCSRGLWQGAAGPLRVGLVYIGVLSGLSTVVQLRAPNAYRGRILAFFLVALGVSYPVGSLVQGPVTDQIGLGWTTAGAAGLLSLIMVVVVLVRPGIVRAITAGPRAIRPAEGRQLRRTPPSCLMPPSADRADGHAWPEMPPGSRRAQA